MKTFLIPSAALFCLANIAMAQEAVTTSANPKPPPTPASPSNSATPSPSPSAAPVAGTAEQVTVTSQELDISREAIVPNLGATRYTIGPDRLDSQAQGENAPFNQTILRFPGVAQDSFGQLHVRGEHANLQYRIDDVLLPESIPGFGPELATRFADNISLITGALPAQFGFRETGRSEEHTSELQSQFHLVCRLLLEKKKQYNYLSLVILSLCLPSLITSSFIQTLYMSQSDIFETRVSVLTLCLEPLIFVVTSLSSLQ